VSKLKPRVSILEHRLSMHQRTILVSSGARFSTLEAQLYFPRPVSRGGSYFGSDKDPSGAFFKNSHSLMHVILIGLSGLASLGIP
jgi:hypothetical protein